MQGCQLALKSIFMAVDQSVQKEKLCDQEKRDSKDESLKKVSEF